LRRVEVLSRSRRAAPGLRHNDSCSKVRFASDAKTENLCGVYRPWRAFRLRRQDSFSKTARTILSVFSVQYFQDASSSARAKKGIFNFEQLKSRLTFSSSSTWKSGSSCSLTATEKLLESFAATM